MALSGLFKTPHQPVRRFGLTRIIAREFILIYGKINTLNRRVVVTNYKSKHRLLLLLSIVTLVVVLAGSAAAATSVFAPATYQKITQAIKGNSESLQVKVNDLSNKYLAEGASNDTILVKFKDNVSEEQSAKVHQKLNTKVKNKIDKINVEVVNIPAGAKVGDMIAKFKNESDVEYAEPNFLAAAQLDPNDSLYSSQWNLSKISAPTAWDDSQGGAGPIAIVDTGVESNHPDLSGEVIQGYNFVSSSKNTEDDNGHGTHVTGIVSALTNNAKGVASIGFRSNILPVKVLDSSGNGSYSDVASGIIYSTDQGARVINLSLGGPTQSSTLQDAVTYATNKGSFVVAAAGNSGSSTPLYPAACTGALAISATDSADNLASFSSYGKNVFAGAPGVNITSTYNNSGYRSLSGTSMSAPHFSGLVEIAISFIGSSNKSVTNAQLLDYLKTATDKVGPYPYDQNGWNQYFGYGRINAQKLFGEIKQSPIASPTATSSASAIITTTPSSVKSGSPSSRPSISFSVEALGEVDSISTENQVVKIKIKNISKNINVSADDFVDLYLDSSTQIKYQGKDKSLSDLKAGDEINVKSLWANDRLQAQTITIQKLFTTEPTATPGVSPTTTTTTNANTPGSSNNSAANNNSKANKK